MRGERLGLRSCTTRRVSTRTTTRRSEWRSVLVFRCPQSALPDRALHRMQMFALNASTDGVPWGYGNPVTPLYWDFSAPRPTTLDTSASAIFDTALILLLSLDASRGNASSTWFYPATDLFANSALFTGTNTSLIQTQWTGASILGNATINNRADPCVQSASAGEFLTDFQHPRRPLNNTGAVYGSFSLSSFSPTSPADSSVCRRRLHPSRRKLLPQARHAQLYRRSR